jgi:LacI family transcriptional regulator
MKPTKASDRTSYHKIAGELIQQVRTGGFVEGSFLPIERDLMAEYGVTRTTVRRALSQVVEEGFGKLVPNKGVLAVRKGATGSKAIGFIDGSSVVLRSLYARLNASFLNLGYHLVHIDSQVIGLENALLFAHEREFEGAFVWSFEGFPDNALLERIQRTMPLVALDHSLGSFHSDLVTFDYMKMAHEAVGHLIKSGRRRIAVTGMLDMLDTTHQRFSGYMRGLFENGQTPDVRDYVFCYTSGYLPPNHDHLASRLASADRPDALFVMQDEFVPGVVQTVLGCGLRIPDDIAIATIGDDVVVSVGGQDITAVHCDWDGFAGMALDLMLRRIKEPHGPRERLLGKHEVVSSQPSTKFVGDANAQTLMVTRRGRAGAKEGFATK